MSNTDFEIVCDETNNTQETIDQGKLIVDIYIPQYYYELKFVVPKDGILK
jgi:phage tail sheath protein FI